MPIPGFGIRSGLVGDLTVAGRHGEGLKCRILRLNVTFAVIPD
jgi:hypothetical protein